MKLSKFFVGFMSIFAFPTVAFADPLHFELRPLIHYFTEFFHVIPIVGVMALATYLIYKKIYSKK